MTLLLTLLRDSDVDIDTSCLERHGFGYLSSFLQENPSVAQQNVTRFQVDQSYYLAVFDYLGNELHFVGA